MDESNGVTVRIAIAFTKYYDFFSFLLIIRGYVVFLPTSGFSEVVNQINHRSPRLFSVLCHLRSSRA